MVRKSKPYTSLRADRTDDYFNYNLRNARIKEGYTLEQVAKKVGIAKETVHAYERLRALPSPSNARRISRLLGQKISYLFPKKLRTITREIQAERRSETREQPYGSAKNPIYLGEVSADQFIDDSAPDVPSQIPETTLKDKITQALRTLQRREREVIKLRYGMINGRNYTLKEISRIFGIGKERVRQIEFEAIRRLEHPSRSRPIKRFLETS